MRKPVGSLMHRGFSGYRHRLAEARELWIREDNLKEVAERTDGDLCLAGYGSKSRTNTSIMPLVSSGTKLVACEVNATSSPFSEIALSTL